MDIESQEIRLARQRASVKWLLSKAFNNRVPDNLKEPFYRDHENQERLKPQIVVEMGNATLYCQTLSNLYSDPNYQSLNHWSILQTLARKGVPVTETADMPLTETVLIQTNPLRINAHMSVIESLMILYAKEISSGDRIANAVRRICGSNTTPATGQNYEQSLLTWISHVCASLKKRIAQEIESGATDENGVRLQTPDIPPVRDFQDLCDGVCLALLISYYCPKVVPWTSVRINYLPAVEDSIHNVLLVSNFSQKHLPYSVFHMTPEDITYMRGSMKQNLIVLLADLFNLFEIHPAKCVCYPGMEMPEDIKKRNSTANEHGICHRRGLTCQPVTPIPDLRSDLDTPSGSPSNRPPFQVTRSASATLIMRRPTPPKENQTVEHNNYQANDEGFVVHKTRGITTLSSMHSQQQHNQQQQQEPLVPARLRQAKEKNNMETKADERGDYVPAGRPSNWDQNRRTSFAGRRSRRNSSSEDSQLTIENFGGSQDQLNMIGRIFDRDRDRERERKLSSASIEPAVAVRSSLADARGTLQLGYDTDSGSEKQDRETEKYIIKRQGSVDNVSLRSAMNMTANSNGNSNTTSSSSITIKQHSIEKDFTDADTQHSILQQQHNNLNNTKSNAYNAADEEMSLKMKTTFSPITANTTTWQQQSAIMSQTDQRDPYEEDTRPLVDASKLSTIRMKLEEKRRRIEQEKRKIEIALSRHQEKVGKAAFLQAINKGKQQQQKQSTIATTSENCGDSKEQQQEPTQMDINSTTHAVENVAGSSSSTFISGGSGGGVGGSGDGNCDRSLVKNHQQQQQQQQSQQHQQDDIESSSDSMKWETLSNESKRTPDIDPIDLDKYQQSIAIMNSNLQDIQQDIHRLATQQNQIQAQHLQAQQLIQAQQIANMLNQQQPYGSQQHLPGQYQRSVQQQQHSNFGSTPHLQQSYTSPVSAYNSRPPSRDPFQQQQQQQHQPIQYVNEHGQYINHQQTQHMMQQQQQQSLYSMHHHLQQNNLPSVMYSRENSQFMAGNENGIQPPTINNHPYGGGSGHQYQQELPNQFQSHQFVNRPSEYEEYSQATQIVRDANTSQPNQFYLHESSPQPMQRRTWAQSAAAHEQLQQQQSSRPQQSLVDVSAWQSQNMSPKITETPRTTTSWKTAALAPVFHAQATNNQGHHGANSGTGGTGFMLHQNGNQNDFNHQEKTYQNLFPVHASPQHLQSTPTRNLSMTNLKDNCSPASSSATTTANAKSSKARQNSTSHPPPDDMAPQSICFIGDEEDIEQLEMNIIDSMQSTRLIDHNHHSNSRYPQQQQQQQQQQQHQHQQRGIDGNYDNDLSLGKLNITSGSLTYRIPSPSRPSLNANSFQDPQEESTNEKGFYISFDDDQPKRPKPPLRAKRSPKKEKSIDSVDHQIIIKRDSLSQLQNNFNNSDNNDLKHNNLENSKATYNKYTDAPIHLRQLTDNNHHHHHHHQNHQHQHNQTINAANTIDRRHLEDVTNQQQQHQSQHQQQINSSRHSGVSSSNEPKENNSKALVIGSELANLDRDSVDEMERKKEKIMLLSLQRRQQQEEAKARKEIESNQRREREREKEEERARKKEEQVARRAAILEQHRLKKAIEEAEREGKTLDRSELMLNKHLPSQQNSGPRLRQQKNARPRPKTIHVESGSVDISEASSLSSRGKKGSSTNLTGGYSQLSSNSMRRDYYRGSQDSLTVKESPDEYPSTSSTPIGRRGSYKNSREPTVERGRTLSRISVAKGSSLNFRGRKSNSLMNLCDTDSGLGRATPPRRAPSPGMAPSAGSRHMPSPSGPGSLPPGLVSKRRVFDDGSSDISSTPNSMMEYSGPKLYKQPAAKSNRGIILNAVEYCVFPGAVNRDAKQKVLEKIARSEAKHFLVLFRDAGCQFRALYSYVPETDQVFKLYGTGPSQVDEVMFDKFFKYNSGGKCFSQVHTKHLTVTIDAFTIHNSLWQGKKVQLPSKKDMALVI